MLATLSLWGPNRITTYDNSKVSFVRLDLSTKFVSYLAVFLSFNKSANNIFCHDLSAKQIGYQRCKVAELARLHNHHSAPRVWWTNSSPNLGRHSRGITLLCGDVQNKPIFIWHVCTTMHIYRCLKTHIHARLEAMERSPLGPAQRIVFLHFDSGLGEGGVGWMVGEMLGCKR